MTPEDKRDVERLEAKLAKEDPEGLYNFCAATLVAIGYTAMTRERACELVFYVFARRLIQQPMEDILIELGVN